MTDMILASRIEDVARSLKAQAHQEKVRNAIYAINSLDHSFDSEIIRQARLFLMDEFGV